MRMYISGPIKDVPDHKKKFAKAEETLRKIMPTATIINPCKLPPGLTYGEYMRLDLQDLLSCDTIYMLLGWERSAGARCEHLVAAMCDIPILYEAAVVVTK